MKFKTTKKEVLNGCGLVVKCGYCEVQDLFHGVDPNAYTCGQYGWNADIYIDGGTALVTGYRPFGDSGYEDIISTYNERARNVLNSIEDISWLKSVMLDSLRKEFFDMLRMARRLSDV